MITKYLGIQFKRDRTTRELWIHQADYTCHLLDEYGLSDCHPILLPMDPNHPFLRDEDAAKLPEIPDISSLYPKLIGELLYLSVCTRPDIVHAVQRLSQHLSCPTPRLFATAKRVLCYLASTVNYRLYYGGATRTEVILHMQFNACLSISLIQPHASLQQPNAFYVTWPVL